MMIIIRSYKQKKATSIFCGKGQRCRFPLVACLIFNTISDDILKISFESLIVNLNLLIR